MIGCKQILSTAAAAAAAHNSERQETSWKQRTCLKWYNSSRVNIVNTVYCYERLISKETIALGLLMMAHLCV